MRTSYYRIQDGARDVADLLDPRQWQSRQYGHEVWATDPVTGADVEDVRFGVSTCESVKDLAAYIARSGVEVDTLSAVIVELDARVADDEDHDSELGAVLVHPRSVIAVHDPDAIGFWDMVNNELED